MQNKCLGVFLVFITIPLVILSIVNLGADKLTTASYYKELFKKSNAYDLTVQALPKSETTSNEDIIAAITNNMTPAWLEQNITKNLDQFDAYFNGRTTAIDPSVDISSFKNALTLSLPTEFKSLVPNIISFSTYNDYLTQTEKLITQNPGADPAIDQANIVQIKQQLNSSSNSQQQLLSNLASAKHGYQLAIIFRYILYALTILMLLTIAIAARHWYPAIFRWLGQTLLIGGVLTLGLFFALQKVAAGLDIVSKFNLANGIKQTITPLYNNIFQDITFGVEKISLVIAIIGLIFVISSYILPIFVPEPKKAITAPTNS